VTAELEGTEMMSPTDFEGRKGIRYYSQFKPSAPYGISDGIFIVPSGWQMLALPEGGMMRVSRSHFVMPPDWSAKRALERFRDWLIFDAFVLINSRASGFYDSHIFGFEDVAYSVYTGSIGDAGDLLYSLNYDDVSSYLVDQPFTTVNVPSLSYAELYKTYLALPAEIKSAIEWFISPPPGPRRIDDAFFGSYWGLLHITILIEDIIGPPPDCEHKLEECEFCGRTPPRHHKSSQKDWRREQLKALLSDTNRVEEYATLIETAYKIRHPMSHGPHFDRSSLPIMAHDQTEVYDVARAVREYEKDSSALCALFVGLRTIAHALLVDRAFGIKYFAPISDLKSVTIGVSG
jgi:hypothetical protein